MQVIEHLHGYELVSKCPRCSSIELEPWAAKPERWDALDYHTDSNRYHVRCDNGHHFTIPAANVAEYQRARLEHTRTDRR